MNTYPFDLVPPKGQAPMKNNSWLAKEKGLPQVLLEEDLSKLPYLNTLLKDHQDKGEV